MSITCVCCGKVWDSESRHVDGERKRCSHRVACVTRALGPTPAKTHARKMSRERLI